MFFTLNIDILMPRYLSKFDSPVHKKTLMKVESRWKEF